MVGRGRLETLTQDGGNFDTLGLDVVSRWEDAGGSGQGQEIWSHWSLSCRVVGGGDGKLGPAGARAAGYKWKGGPTWKQ